MFTDRPLAARNSFDMEEYIEQLYSEMREALEIIELEEKDRLTAAEASIKLIKEKMDQLRNFIISDTFKGVENEIRFFKEWKPKFHSALIYFSRIFYLETHSPEGSRLLKQALLDKEMQYIERFFERNIAFLTYFKSGASYLDHQLFTRKGFTNLLDADDYSLPLDPAFSCLYSYKLSCIHAFGLLQQYLQDTRLGLNAQTSLKRSQEYGHLRWTARKTELIELLYALHSSGLFNHGRVSVRDVALLLEEAFGIKLGNYYRVFQNIRIRQKNRTAFLDLLKENLLKRMDETDENPKNY